MEAECLPLTKLSKTRGSVANNEIEATLRPDAYNWRKLQKLTQLIVHYYACSRNQVCWFELHLTLLPLQISELFTTTLGAFAGRYRFIRHYRRTDRVRICTQALSSSYYLKKRKINIVARTIPIVIGFNISNVSLLVVILS